jgi:hypothetical protein
MNIKTLSRPGLLRTAAAAGVLASVIAIGSGCVVAVRPAPYAYGPVYAEPGEVVVDRDPPAPIVEVQGEAPGPGFIWVGGYYHWYGGRWAWYRGHYAHPPHSGAVWVGPRYGVRGGARIYVHGYWR